MDLPPGVTVPGGGEQDGGREGPAPTAGGGWVEPAS